MNIDIKDIHFCYKILIKRCFKYIIITKVRNIMYRVFCESYENFINSMDKDSYRIKMAKPLELIVNIEKYKDEEKKESELYKKYVI